jgi:protein structure with unknown function
MGDVDTGPSQGESSGAPAQPEWPTLVRYAGDAELRVVRDQDEWDLDPELHARPFRPEDRLIDSVGLEYRLVFTGPPRRGRNSIHATGHRHTPPDVQAIAARYLASFGAQPEWLVAHLREIPDGHRIHATILYLAKLAAADASAASDEEE